MVMLITEKRTIALLISQLEKNDATTAAIKAYFQPYCDHSVVDWIKAQIIGNNTAVISKIQEIIAAPEPNMVFHNQSSSAGGFMVSTTYARGRIESNSYYYDDLPPMRTLRVGDNNVPFFPLISVDICGDSVTRGVAVTTSPIDYIKLNRTAWDVTDHSAGGLCTRDLLNGYAEPDAGLPTSYWPNGPQPAFDKITRMHKFVVLQTGFNDAFRSIPSFDSNMRKLIDIVLREDRVPVLTGVFDTNINVPGRAANNAATIQIAADYGLQHAGWGEDFFPADVATDTIHRTQGASNRMANTLIAAIERAYNALKP